MAEPADGTAGDGSSRQTRLYRAIRSVFGEAAKKIYVRVFAAALLVLGALLTFIPHVFEVFRKVTDHPEILPVTLLVPYMYLIFEMVLSRLERDEDSTEQNRRFEARLLEVPERRLERNMIVETFNQSMEDLPSPDARRGSSAVGDWTAAEGDSTIEMLILAYSSESVLDGVLQFAGRIRENIESGIAPPERIIVKLLTRDLRTTWRLPCLSSREADEKYRRGLNENFRRYLSRWNLELFQAFEFLSREKIVLSVRWYQFEPMYKATIVNRKVGLVGVYPVHEVNLEGVRGWDYYGKQVRLYEVRADGASPRSQLALKRFTELFDKLWEDHSDTVPDF